MPDDALNALLQTAEALVASEVLCDHANETPRGACPCPSWCACKRTMCGDPALAFPIVRRPPNPLSPPVIHYSSIGRKTLLVESLESAPAPRTAYDYLTD